MPIGEIVRFDALEYLPISVNLFKSDPNEEGVPLETKIVYIPKMMLKNTMTIGDLHELELMVVNSLDFPDWENARAHIDFPDVLKQKPIIVMFPIFSDEV
jgi:hypothetical protein